MRTETHAGECFGEGGGCGGFFDMELEAQEGGVEGLFLRGGGFAKTSHAELGEAEDALKVRMACVGEIVEIPVQFRTGFIKTGDMTRSLTNTSPQAHRFGKC